MTELIVVVALFGVLAALGVPNLLDTGRRPRSPRVPTRSRAS
jgi:Tfp pilus assembly protein FimT